MYKVRLMENWSLILVLFEQMQICRFRSENVGSELLFKILKYKFNL